MCVCVRVWACMITHIDIDLDTYILRCNPKSGHNMSFVLSLECDLLRTCIFGPLA